MTPKTVVFDELPKTATGKTQKFVLREKARAMGSLTKSVNTEFIRSKFKRWVQGVACLVLAGIPFSS
ncbi:hypothetical protein E2562_023917 [Oryza meyeriana var. granulata]|uniref:AMP-binding enzyme C-terminal domain-containing protein n=1 Tax=Oryza meyeriana var. granulata TaxID=110450 RepID=A0A6G1BY71_9ORYZ|nr:hypothetical protein E2562_023917 [Oryza meyeriana var. granulata]